ncbi:MAG TPA: hypothetical protein EYQ74_00535 [Planctomycetes bacterium]|nr:hypothetical protein [Planctomycetota bacterium]
MVLALSNEPASKVEPYVEQYNLPFPVASGSTAGGKLGAMVGQKGIPHSYLLDPEGRLVWHGHPNSLTKKHLKLAMAGADRVGPKAVLSWRGEIDGAPPKALEAAADGELAQAFKLIEKEAGSEGAGALDESLSAHVADLRKQIDLAVGRGDFGQSLAALESLAKDLKRHPLGEAILERQREIEEDETIQNEIEAAEALDKALELVANRGIKKAKKSLQSVVKRFPSTHAAKRARGLIGE